ncbi:Down syndrome cell adhesion molecule homolog isoform X2 [Haliotis rufescens]|nr:Down syndrome cell adhesion molecule homolog isoform X2 [Haliotis rufescens]
MYSRGGVVLACLLHAAIAFQFTREPSDVVVGLNSSVWFDCKATDDDIKIVYYSWRFRDADLVPDENTEIHANGSLLVKNVQMHNAGAYGCIALTGRQSIYSRLANLTLATLRPFTVMPVSGTARVGVSTSLECAVESVPLPVIEWVKNGLMITSGDVTQTGYRSRLTISTVTYTDQGYYSCVATNTFLHQTANSSQAFLTVEGKPVLVHPPGNLTVPEMYTAVFDCIVIGNPRPNVDWLKVNLNGVQTQLPLQGRISKYPNGTLVLRGAIKDDTGRYTCLARNGFGEDSATASLAVEGPAHVPVITIFPNSSLTTELGSAVLLQCFADGNPTPRINWKKANGSLSSNVAVTGGELALPAVKREDDGVYICVSINDLGRTQKNLTLSVQYGPDLDEGPVSQEVELGSAVVLACAATANPPPVYTWDTPAAGNVSVSSGSVGGMKVTDEGSLQIEKASPSHHGTYTCVASNRIAAITTSAVLSVKGPPIFTSTPAGQLVSAGETVEFTCKASGYPSPSILWTKGGQLLRTGDKYEVAASGTLTVRRAGKEDAGIYRCFAKNTAGQIDAPATLNIIKFPYFELPSSNLTVGLGGDAKLDCRAMGDPVPTQKWERNGSAVIIDDNMQLFTNHTLLIDDIRTYQFGEYTCVAVNMGGVNSTTLTIIPGEFPYLITRPTNATSILGTNVTLQCRGQSGNPFSMRWAKTSVGDGQGSINIRSNTEEEQTARVTVKRNGDLQFISIRKSDEGWYTCSAVNKEGNVTADPVYVRVHTPPQILSTNSPVSVLAKSQVKLSCNVSGDPAPTLKWKSPAGTQVTPITVKYIPAGLDLTITSVDSREDGGWWTCEACNVVACAMGGVQLLIEGEPVIRTDQSLRNATTIALVCRAFGLPIPNLTYSRGSTVIDRSTLGHRVEGQWLYISASSLGDTYTCTAENRHGSSTKTFTKPDPGPSLTSINVTSREITVTWEPVKVSGNLFVTGSHLKYNQASATSATVSEVSMLLGHRVTGLLPYTTYVFAVSVTNVLGTGSYGHSLTITTRAEAPTSPVAVAARVLNSTVTVTWFHSLHLYGNIDDVEYQVSLVARGPSGEYDTQVKQQTQSAKNTLEASINAEYGSYQVSVRAINSLINMSSDPTSVMVNVYKPAPVFVPQITVSPIDHQSLSVRWNTSTTNTPEDVRGYVIYYRKLDRDDREYSVVTVDGAAKHTALISNLEEQTTYEVKVAAVNVGGQGPLSGAQSTKTKLKLFSLAAYSGVDMGTSGQMLAVLAGCISLLLLLLVIICLCLQHRRLKKMDSVSFLKPSHRLDRFYLENPKGLYRDKPRRRGASTAGRGLYTFTNTGYLWGYGDGISTDSDVELVKTTWLPEAGRYNTTLVEAHRGDERGISRVKPPPLGEIEILPDIRIYDNADVYTSAANADSGIAYDMSSSTENSDVLDNFILQPTHAVLQFEGTSGDTNRDRNWDTYSANSVTLDVQHFQELVQPSSRSDTSPSGHQQLCTNPTLANPCQQYIISGDENVPNSQWDLSVLPSEATETTDVIIESSQSPLVRDSNDPLLVGEPAYGYRHGDLAHQGVEETTLKEYDSLESSGEHRRKDTLITTAMEGESNAEDAINTTPELIEHVALAVKEGPIEDGVLVPQPLNVTNMTPLATDRLLSQSNVVEDNAASCDVPTYVSSARLQLHVGGPTDSMPQRNADTDIDEFIENAPDPESDGASIHSSDLFTDSGDETQAPLFMYDQDKKTAVLY